MATYYAHPDGTAARADAATGPATSVDMSKFMPMSLLQDADATGLLTGDTVYLMPGTYTGRINVSASGTGINLSNLTLSGYSDTDRPVIDGTGETQAFFCQKDTTRILNLIFSGGTSSAASFSGSVVGSYARNCDFQNSAGIGLVVQNVPDFTGIDLTAHHNGTTGMAFTGAIVNITGLTLCGLQAHNNGIANPDANVDGIFIGNGVTDFVLQNSRVWDHCVGHTAAASGSHFDFSGGTAGGTQLCTGMVIDCEAWQNGALGWIGFATSGLDAVGDNSVTFDGCIARNMQRGAWEQHEISTMILRNCAGTVEDWVGTAYQIIKLASGATTVFTAVNCEFDATNADRVYAVDTGGQTITATDNVLRGGRSEFATDDGVAITAAQWRSLGYDTGTAFFEIPLPTDHRAAYRQIRRDLRKALGTEAIRI